MQTTKNLLNSDRDKKAGNHRVEQVGNERHFYYFWTVICKVNDTNKTFSIDASYGTVSTKRACSSYRNHLSQMGYKEI